MRERMVKEQGSDQVDVLKLRRVHTCINESSYKFGFAAQLCPRSIRMGIRPNDTFQQFVKQRENERTPLHSQSDPLKDSDMYEFMKTPDLMPVGSAPTNCQ
jgi:hypothetical protein